MDHKLHPLWPGQIIITAVDAIQQGYYPTLPKQGSSESNQLQIAITLLIDNKVYYPQ